MKLKIPVLERCCFCLPLRHGLVAWGCFKMIADAFIITILLISLSQAAMMARKALGSDDDILSMIAAELIIPVIALAIFIADFEVTLMFVIGGLEKNVKLTEVFYFISIAMWMFSLLVAATYVVIAIQVAEDNFGMGFSFYILNLVVQTYFLILLRSEIIKLKNGGESSSQNNATEAESYKKCEEIVVEEEAGKEVV